VTYLQRREAQAQARAKEASAKRRAANRKRGELRKHARVRARPIEPGKRYMVTRRTLERRMFLLPDDAQGEDIVNFLGFTLGLAIQDSGQKLHAALVMSNHHHTVVTDTDAKLPKFKNKFHSFVARGVNAKRGRFDAFWSADGPCDVEQLTDLETLEDIVYDYTNPVEAGLVKWAHQWPGFSTYGWKFGEVHRFRRPKWFYDPDNEDVPEYVDLVLTRPDIFPELSDDELHDLIMKKVRERELEIHEELAKSPGRIMGPAKLRKQRWSRAARSFEERFNLTPKVASTCKWIRIARLQRKAEWDLEYAIARAALLRGENPIFPYGTYWMRHFAGVRVAAAP
jgi:REP element-mobilizing transposase RayT